MSAMDTARLLPWCSPDGKPCYLAGDGTGYVSRRADTVEAAQLDLAAVLIKEARHILDGRSWTSGEIHLLAVELTECLTDVHRVAESRGARLPAPDHDRPDIDDDDADGGPRLPAAAFG
ncbi:hypothetical protein [Streptomyces chattanoogensis]|uniref:Uncharacterized protein n=1 Tax=Streptomyces chattanoogensis TaxID=66876 RepID=A0A0N0XZ11_9ACTN|nr:hypothetical protein [Streptomyces chattanoogensis]KPC63707.1 hypothetical protein ADL29_14900 [Streptomyces chattanoogensis]